MVMLATLALASCESVEVTTVDVAVVNVTPQGASVQVNSTIGMSASVMSSSGTPLSGRSVAWSSLDPDVASVNQSGTVLGLAPGTARIQASSEGVSGQAIVTVTARRPVITIAPTNLAFTAPQGGADPPAQTATIGEEEGAELTGLSAEVAYPVGQAAGWVDASLNATTAPAVLTVRAITGPLAAGTYAATVRISSAGASNSPRSVEIEFVVQPPLPAIGLSRPNITFAGSVGGADPAAVQVDVTNAGAGTVSGLSRTITYGAGQPTGWLTAVLAGTAAPTTLTVSAAIGSLANGSYTATVRLTSSTAVNSPIDIPVALAIANVAPGTPGGLQAAALSASRIDLSWTAASTGGAVERYRIERRTDGGSFALIDSVGGGTLSYQNSGLSPATQYSYRVRGCNAVGCSDPSNEASATTAQVAPGAPTNLQADVVSGSRIDLSWAASAGAVAWYMIERRTGGGAFAVIDSVADGTLTYQNTGLLPATQYTYRVRACNPVGCSGFSNQASATTLQLAPGTPTGLQANAVSASRIDLSWSAAAGLVTWYRIERRTGGGAFAVIDSVPGVTLSYQNTGLSPATQYGYRVSACNLIGCSSASTEATATTLQVAPGAPSGLQATTISASRIDLAWSAASGAVGWYSVERRTGGGEFAVIDSLAGGTLSYQSTGLAPATQYDYRVRACNTAGCSSYSNEASATTLQVPPGAPSGLQATTISDSRIDLAWSAATGTVVWYRVERRTGPGPFTAIDSLDAGTLSYQDTGLSPVTQYTYRVQACNTIGCSNSSNQASATTLQIPPDAPSDLQATAMSSTRIDLIWNASTGGPVERYRIERRADGASFVAVDSVSAGTINYEDTGLLPETLYHYRVQACNIGGCSPYSNEVSATTPPPEPVEARRQDVGGRLFGSAGSTRDGSDAGIRGHRITVAEPMIGSS